MNKSDFYYDLPKELIAQSPVEPRDSSRLLVYSRATGVTQHKHFYDLPNLLQKGDLLVVNNTRVLPARITGVKDGTGASISFLLHKRIAADTWETLCRPAKRARVGTTLCFSPELKGVITAEGDDGARTVKFEYDGVFEEILYRIGEMPLPHYIHGELKDKDRYQTVYARENGSAAAPTAGLHFTDRLIAELKDGGVEFAEVLLHVGLGTFLPVKTEKLEEHKMHSELYCLTQQTADRINAARAQGRRVIAVGTTSVRVLETCAAAHRNHRRFAIATAPHHIRDYSADGIKIFTVFSRVDHRATHGKEQIGIQFRHVRVRNDIYVTSAERGFYFIRRNEFSLGHTLSFRRYAT